MDKINRSVVICCAAAGVCLLLSGPFAGLNWLFAVLAAGLLAAASLAGGLWTAAAALAAGTVVSAAVGGGVNAVMTALGTAAMAFFLYFGNERGWSFKRMMLTAAAAMVVVSFAEQLAAAYIQTGVINKDSLMVPFEMMFDAFYEQLVAAGTAAGAARQIIDRARVGINNTIVSYIVLSAVTETFAAFLICRSVSRRVFGSEYPAFSFMQGFRMDRTGGIIFLAAFALSIFVGSGFLGAVLNNFIIILIPPFFLGGLSVVLYMMDMWEFPRYARSALYVCIALSLFFPYFSLLDAFAVLGALDAAGNYRKLGE